MTDEVSGIPSLNAAKLKAQQLEALRQTAKIDARQEAVEETLEENCQYSMYSLEERNKSSRTLEERLSDPNEVARKKVTKGDSKSQQSIEQSAEKFAARNPEFNPRALLVVRQNIHEDDSPQDIIAKVRNAYPDHYLTDETIDFLIETSVPGSKQFETLKKTKERFNTLFEREIKAGRNISTEARAFSTTGLGTPTGLRDLYRDITGNPRPPLDLFNELMKSFDYEKLKQAIEFIMHSLGADMKAKGPSISIGELQTLFSSARTMQAILGVFNFFKSRMNLISGAFARDDIELPSRITFQLLAEKFMHLIAERYPSTDKILRLAQLLGVSEEYLAQIILFTQYRDAMRNVSPRLFKSDRHRQDLLRSTMDALSELEDLLEEEDKDEDEDEEDDK